MSTKIVEHISDSSDTGISISISDSAGVVVGSGAVSSITYTLSDTLGNIINSRDGVSATVANPVLIKLTKDDTKVVKTSTRLLTVTWVYTDSLLGAGTEKTEEFTLTIDNVVKV